MAGKKKDKTTMWVALGLLVAGGVYWWNKSKQASASSTVAPGAPAGSTLLPTTNPIVTPAPAPEVAPTITTPTSPVQSAAPPPLVSPGAVTSSGVSYDPRMDTLQAWAQSLSPCDLSRWNASKTNFTPDEWNGLFDLYFNDWVGGQGNNDARTTFWDNWRVKYSILTNTPC